MATRGKEILMVEMEKKVYDMRGNQANIIRLFYFDKWAFIHMLFYRILMLVSVIFGITLLLSLFVSSLAQFVKALLILVWILFTPQIVESGRLFALMASNGYYFSHFNEEYLFVMRTKYKAPIPLLAIVPYAVLAIWILGFFAMLMWWRI